MNKEVKVRTGISVLGFPLARKRSPPTLRVNKTDDYWRLFLPFFPTRFLPVKVFWRVAQPQLAKTVSGARLFRVGLER